MDAQLRMPFLPHLPVVGFSIALGNSSLQGPGHLAQGILGSPWLCVSDTRPRTVSELTVSFVLIAESCLVPGGLAVAGLSFLPHNLRI